ncbi:transposase [Thauera linaloolentis]|uniref:Transposase IS3/IS911 family protein n=1 Tax=Thauera linaloolentis (strain DSM 12138 / JCM 21573 / CCUG 41526 / CIP 105981 / IAM 15112 / NBRC 102519 / 47Lol) TaxID=1123367 RepID=N6Z850_THAL4|nr:transposase IS3/IS911 family protein [Thauera linaloolentis 47Lol = DSM 12138]
MTKSTRARYTLESKLEVVRLVKSGQGESTTAKILGIVQQTLHNWVKVGHNEKL